MSLLYAYNTIKEKNMAVALIDNRCAGCGKMLTDGKNAIIMGDITIQGTSHVKFKPGIDTRNVYCNVFCLEKDLSTN